VERISLLGVSGEWSSFISITYGSGMLLLSILALLVFPEDSFM